jgi:uncharacterized protein YggE
MKRPLIKTVSLFLRSCPLLLPLTLPPLASAADSDRKQIIVQGEGESTRKPDYVSFVIGIDVKGPTLEKVREKADDTMRRLLQISKEFKVENPDIQSDYFQVQPITDQNYQDHGKPNQTTTSYQVLRNVRIVYRDLDRYDAFLEALFKTGLNQLYNVQLGSSQLAQMEEEAQTAALKNAKTKAESMAKVLDLKVGKARTINEANREMGIRPIQMMAMAEMKSSSRSGSINQEPTLAPGELRVGKEITVVFDAD